MNGKRIGRSTAPVGYGIAGLLLLVAGCGSPDPGTFATPEEAVQAVAGLIGAGDDQQTEAIFGPGSAELFGSGDAVAAREDAERVKAMILAKVAFEEFDEKTRVAFFGEQAWPMPIPLVRTADGKRWRFDTAAGREELLNRRIGRNELSTLTSLHALVDAQYEYRSTGRDDNPPAFARRFFSTAGAHDGLYWEPTEGEALSPLGDLFAEAEGYGAPEQAFHGYHYRMISTQGKSAPGGEKSYLDAQGRLTHGFAAIAWPAKYGNSGLMTFLINHQGIAFQKDLGADTGTAVTLVEAYDPDESWDPTGNSLDEVDLVTVDDAPETAETASGN